MTTMKDWAVHPGREYLTVKADAQKRADEGGLYFRIVRDMFGYNSTCVPRPELQCGRDLEGELVRPTRLKGTS
jgi:hypothetical protein